MTRSYRIPWAHLLALLLPCAIIAFLGYRWLNLEREAQLRRGRDAAAATASELHSAVLEHLTQVMAQAAPQWLERTSAPAPFLRPPDLPLPLSAAWLVSSSGTILLPGYETRFQQAVGEYEAGTRRPEWQRASSLLEQQEKRGDTAAALGILKEYLASHPAPPLRAWTLLNLARISLAARDSGRARAWAAELTACCPGARDEFGTPLALYAVTQLAVSWREQDQARARAAAIAQLLQTLLRQGWIGHPRDLPEIAAVARAAGPAGAELRRDAEAEARRISAATEAARRAREMVSWPLAATQTAAFVPSPTAGRLVAAIRAGEGAILLATVDVERLSAWVAARAAATDFDASVVTHTPVSRPDASAQPLVAADGGGYDLVLRPRSSDPSAQRSREALFVAALAAALLLTMLAGYFAVRDVVRERQLAALRSSFVAGVTHELKTPLASIRLLAETLRLGRARSSATREQVLDTIVGESERLTRLLDNVLNFSRIERGVREYRPLEVPLGQAVTDAVTRFRSVLDQEGFTLCQQLEARNDARICVDPDAFTESVLNLLSNAVKFSGPAREVELAVRADEAEAEISVTDHGCGIAAADQKRIFDSFYRTPEAARDTAGAGLGLALVKHFAEAHGGRVVVRSAPGQGSTFSIRLPLRNGSGYGQDTAG